MKGPKRASGVDLQSNARDALCRLAAICCLISVDGRL